MWNLQISSKHTQTCAILLGLHVFADDCYIRSFSNNYMIPPTPMLGLAKYSELSVSKFRLLPYIAGILAESFSSLLTSTWIGADVKLGGTFISDRNSVAFNLIQRYPR